MAHSEQTAAFLRDGHVEPRHGDVDAYFELGMAWSTGTAGAGVDLIQAHKWFNLAAVAGSVRAQECRAEIAEEMSARAIVEAQRQARAWLAAGQRRAA